MRSLYILTLLALCLLLPSCASQKHSNLSYLPQNFINSDDEPTLNVFVPKDVEGTKKDVLIFVHGGNWENGNKGLYSFIGRNFAKKGVVTVIPGYTLSPYADYDQMTQEIVKAILWTKDNIEAYGGDPDRIFLTGHSAGGHLIALATMNPEYLEDPSIVKGIILNDSAGLDMDSYLEENPPTNENYYKVTWTQDPENWKKASPINYITEKTPPMMIYLGTKTYPSIFKYNELFINKLQTVQPEVKPILLDKRHMWMVIQYIWPWSKRYPEIIEFMNTTP